MTLYELEQRKQMILMNINNLFNNPQKESELRCQLEEVETAIEKIRSNNRITYLSEETAPTISDDEIDLNQFFVTSKNIHDQKIIEIDDISDPNKLFDIGMKYRENKEYDKAFSYFLKAANQGNAPAYRELANTAKVRRQYIEIEQIVEWYKTAAELGDSNSQIILGEIYEMGYYGNLKNGIKAIQWYQKAGDQGDPNGYYKIGSMYNSGSAIPQDYTEAAKWFTVASDQYCPAASLSLALLYYHGWGVNLNKPMALKLYQKAYSDYVKDEDRKLKQHVAEIISKMYMNGDGVPKNISLGEKWQKIANELWDGNFSLSD